MKDPIASASNPGLPYRVAPAQQKKKTPGQSAGCRFPSSHSAEECDKLSSAIPQSRQGRPIVARYVSEGALALLKEVGRSGIYPRLSEAKGRVSKTNAPSLRRPGFPTSPVLARRGGGPPRAWRHERRAQRSGACSVEERPFRAVIKM
jgi:hypothetical protein